MDADDMREVPVSALRLRQPGVLELADMDAGGGRFKLRLYSGQPVDHWLFGKLIIDLETLTFKDKLPVLVEHDRGARAGWTDEVKVTNEVVVSGQLMESTGAAQEVRKTREEGFPWEASAGFSGPGRAESVSEGHSVEVNGQKIDGPAEVWRDVRLKEASFVTLGLDQDTGLAAGDAEAKVRIPCAVPLTEDTTMADGVDGKSVDGQKTDESQAQEQGRALSLAQFKELREAFPDDLDFASKMFEEGKTVAEAKAAFADVLVEQLKTSKAENAELKAKADVAALEAGDAAGATPVEGAPPIKQGAEGAAGAGGVGFMDQAKVLVDEKGISMRDAMSRMAADHPDLHKQFVMNQRAGKLE